MDDEAMNPATLVDRVCTNVPMNCSVMKITHNSVSFMFPSNSSMECDDAHETQSENEDVDIGIRTLSNNNEDNVDDIILNNMHNIMDMKDDGSDDDDDEREDDDDDNMDGHGGDGGAPPNNDDDDEDDDEDNDDDDSEDDSKEDEDLRRSLELKLFEELLDLPEDVMNSYFMDNVS